MGVCVGCLSQLINKDFHNLKLEEREEQLCKGCRIKNRKTYTTKFNRGYNYLRRYGITIIDKEAMYTSQKGLCAVCHEEMPSISRDCVVDHCHKTNKVRALLHNKCNTLLGFANEDINKLRGAINYLQKHSSA